MIVSKTPLRISFVGGLTDIPRFYEKHGGAVISTSIDKYVTVRVEQARGRGIEGASPLVRACLGKVGIDGGVSIEIASDVGSKGTGLGSSSALVVGLLNALVAYRSGMTPHLEYLAAAACEVEIDVLGKPTGKQDQYAAAYGGFRRYGFKPDGGVTVSEPFGQVERLASRLLLFDTHIQRSADTILASQRDRNDVGSLLKIKALEESFHNCLFFNEIDDVGEILHAGWQLKRGLSDSTSNPALDEIYRRALDAGAVGGKLLGAGGGGHFLFYVRRDDQQAVKDALQGLATYIPFRFAERGTHIL